MAAPSKGVGRIDFQKTLGRLLHAAKEWDGSPRSELSEKLEAARRVEGVAGESMKHYNALLAIGRARELYSVEEKEKVRGYLYQIVRNRADYQQFENVLKVIKAKGFIIPNDLHLIQGTGIKSWVDICVEEYPIIDTPPNSPPPKAEEQSPDQNDSSPSMRVAAPEYLSLLIKYGLRLTADEHRKVKEAAVQGGAMRALLKGYEDDEKVLCEGLLSKGVDFEKIAQADPSTKAEWEALCYVRGKMKRCQELLEKEVLRSPTQKGYWEELLELLKDSPSQPAEEKEPPKRL